MDGERIRPLGELVSASGLIGEGSCGVALVSGGADSAALLAGLAAHVGAPGLVALHLDYRLRPDSAEDAAVAAELCVGLGVELTVETPRLGAGNVQDAARRARYEAAERLRESRGLDWVATGHSRTDLAETVLYRLASSPGRRSLLGLPAVRGAIRRPLLGAGREQLRSLVAAAGLPFRDDPTNLEPRYARNRIRNEVLPVLAELAPGFELTIAETHGELAEAEALLEALAERALPVKGHAVGIESLRSLEPVLRRLALRRLAERVTGSAVPLGRERADQLWRLATECPEGGRVEIGAGLVAQVEQGRILFERPGPASARPPAVELGVPGAAVFGRWRLQAGPDLHLQVEVEGDEGHSIALDAAALAAADAPLIVRARLPGDRIRPFGGVGSRSLQDLYVDRRVPRSERAQLPVVTVGDRICWVVGLAADEAFGAGPEATEVTHLRADPVGAPAPK